MENNTPKSGFNVQNIILIESEFSRVNQVHFDKEHIQNIHAMKQAVSNGICPRCGKKLVLRHGKYGSFMGCSGYPDCKFTKKSI